MMNNNYLKILCISPILIITSPVWVIHLAAKFMSKIEEPSLKLVFYIFDVFNVDKFFNWIDSVLPATYEECKDGEWVKCSEERYAWLVEDGKAYRTRVNGGINGR